MISEEIALNKGLSKSGDLNLRRPILLVRGFFSSRSSLLFRFFCGFRGFLRGFAVFLASIVVAFLSGSSLFYSIQ